MMYKDLDSLILAYKNASPTFVYDYLKKESFCYKPLDIHTKINLKTRVKLFWFRQQIRFINKPY